MESQELFEPVRTFHKIFRLPLIVNLRHFFKGSLEVTKPANLKYFLEHVDQNYKPVSSKNQ